MKTTVTELEGSRVRVEAEVSTDTIEAAINRSTRTLGKDLRMPGFRRGKVPAPVVLQRFGREVVLDEAVRSSLNGWYAEALRASAIHPVGDPELKLDDLPAAGQPLTFSFEIGVRPTAKLGEYKGVAVAKPAAEADDDAIDAELEALRERQARLETVDDTAADSDFVVVDYVGSIEGEPFDGGQGRDQLIELGGGRLIPGFEEPGWWALRPATSARSTSASPMTIRSPTSPASPRSSSSPSRRSSASSSLISTMPSRRTPRASTRSPSFARTSPRKLRESAERQAEAAFREAVLDAVVEHATVDVPEELIEARAREMWDSMLHSLSHQGITKDLYLQISGRTEDELLRGGQAGRREGAQARGGAGRGRRGRGACRQRRRHPRCAAGIGRARERRAREAARASSRRQDGSGSCARTSCSGMRSTSSSSWRPRLTPDEADRAEARREDLDAGRRADGRGASQKVR